MCLVSLPATVLLVLFKRNNYPISGHIYSYVHTILGLATGLFHWSDTGMTVYRCAVLFLPRDSYRTWITHKSALTIIGPSWLVCLTAVLRVSFDYKGNHMVMTG